MKGYLLSFLLIFMGSFLFTVNLVTAKGISDGIILPEGEKIEATNSLLSSTLEKQAEDGPSLHVGGAVRYNLMLQNYESDITANDGQFTFDTWRLNVVYDNPGGIGLNFEYRFYPTFNTHFIKQGWLEYQFSEYTEVQLGVTQVPFGNLMYNSNSWWFSLPYYVGLEDDFDMGIKMTHRNERYQLDLAYFYQHEPQGPPNLAARYSYDVLPDGNATLQERNQFNVRGAYFTENGEFGVSLQYGQLYNSVLDQFDHRYAAALHGDFTFGNFGIKPQVLYYNMDAVNDQGDDISTVFMGAYAGTYQVATEAWIATLGLSYSMDVSWGPITNVTFYNDISYMEKLVGEDNSLLADGTDLQLGSNFEHSIQNITGFLVSAGPVFTYFDIAQGYNQPWLTDDFGVGAGAGHGDLGGEAEYNIRFNINIGFYF
ncbi:hypothetical protein QLX67_02200 [Balneolaceae bacterium ANBcel3]|nr:hypothetical protein [Balneolaceae bacterium ANBcel3]